MFLEFLKFLKLFWIFFGTVNALEKIQNLLVKCILLFWFSGRYTMMNCELL